MTFPPNNLLTPEQYLEQERKAEYRSEYFDGQLLAKTGSSADHCTIVGNIAVGIHQQFRKRTCEVYANMMRLKVSKTSSYFYPDVVAVCGKPQFEDDEQDILLNPIVIIEVLSPSTESYDRGTKFAHYRTINSLSDYLLIAQDKIHVEHYVRQSDRSWLFSEYKLAKDKFQIDSIGCEVSLEEIYEKVEMEESN